MLSLCGCLVVWSFGRLVVWSFGRLVVWSFGRLVVWSFGRLAPDFKTIADFRKNNAKAIRLVCREFVVICRKLDLFSEAFVAIDGSKFKAVNNRDRNFTRAKIKRRLEDIDKIINRYFAQIESTDRQEASVTKSKTERL